MCWSPITAPCAGLVPVGSESPESGLKAKCCLTQLHGLEDHGLEDLSSGCAPSGSGKSGRLQLGIGVMGSGGTTNGQMDAGITDSDSAMQLLAGPTDTELLALRFGFSSPSWT